MEDKTKITKLLEATINATREGEVKLEYIQEIRNHQARFSSCSEAILMTKEISPGTCISEKINVTADSGCALIRDVMKHPWFN